MSLARIMLAVVLIFSLIGLICISVAIATNAWLIIDVTDSMARTIEVGLWKTCLKTSNIIECKDLLMTLPIILIFIGVGLLVFGFTTAAILLILKRQQLNIALLMVALFLMGFTVLIVNTIIYWFRMLNTLGQSYSTNSLIERSVFSIGYSCILFFVGIVIIILSISMASCITGNLMPVTNMEHTHHRPTVPHLVVQQYSYF